MRQLAVCLALIMLLTALPIGTASSQNVQTLEVWTIALQPYFTDWMNARIAEFEKSHPTVKVKWIDLPCQEFGCKDFEIKFLDALAAGKDIPDVVNLNTLMVLRLAPQGMLVPMSDKVSQKALSQYLPNFLAGTHYKNKSWALPWYVAPPLLMYNFEIFKQAGLAPTKPPRDIDEYLKICRTIKDKTNIYGCMPNVNGASVYFRFQESGLPTLNTLTKKAVFNSPAHVKVLNDYVTLFTDDYFPADTLIRGYYGAVEKYAAGELAMLITGPQFLTRIKRDGKPVYDHTLIAPYPLSPLSIGKSKVIDAPLMNLAVPAQSSKQAIAIEFALFITNETNQVSLAKETVIFPSITINDPVAKKFFSRGGSYPEDQARSLDFAALPFARDLATTIPPEKSTDLARVFQEAIESAFHQTKTPQEALDFAVQEWNKILALP